MKILQVWDTQHKKHARRNIGDISLEDWNFAHSISRSCIMSQKSQNDQIPIKPQVMKMLKIIKITTN